ncbi:hypothetical protein T265_05386 [Opisthorchis viverrini]|uniref:Uncharacterized protein n=1 Tax=Opisthorchis viverrini TaxID=6198 RepID=A0A074ZP33_OPIVI|nr:hypothetical protein T265_05386 [Opisthorchis viverrini]KER27567.1 hypothetical protein T265_05386 [Opisthorchis viverrini]
MEVTIASNYLRWLQHLRSMGGDRISKQLLFGQLHTKKPKQLRLVMKNSPTWGLEETHRDPVLLSINLIVESKLNIVDTKEQEFLKIRDGNSNILTSALNEVTIKVTIESEQNGHSSFLDVNVKKKTDGTIERKVHRKQTWKGRKKMGAQPRMIFLAESNRFTIRQLFHPRLIAGVHQKGTLQELLAWIEFTFFNCDTLQQRTVHPVKSFPPDISHRKSLCVLRFMQTPTSQMQGYHKLSFTRLLDFHHTSSTTCQNTDVCHSALVRRVVQ